MKSEIQLKIINLLNDAMDALEPIVSARDLKDAREHAEHGEYGIAWELLAYLLGEMERPMPGTMVEAGKLMGLIDSEN